jgi:hypothetical protein
VTGPGLRVYDALLFFLVGFVCGGVLFFASSSRRVVASSPRSSSDDDGDADADDVREKIQLALRRRQ